jgi:hypothetical protein
MNVDKQQIQLNPLSRSFQSTETVVLSKKEIEEYIKTHKSVTGEVLEFEEAREQATRLMRLIILSVKAKQNRVK